MINFILSENHNVLGTIVDNRKAIPCLAEADTCNQILLVNLMKDRFTTLFGSPNSNRYTSRFGSIYFLKNKRGSTPLTFESLIADIKRISFSPGTIVNIISEDSLFTHIEKTKLSHIFDSLNNWLIKSGTSVSFFITGSYINTDVLPLLNAHCSKIGSLSIISALTDREYRYRIIFSHTAQGIVTDCHYNFSPESSSFSLLNDIQAKQPEAKATLETDGDEVLTTRSLLRQGEPAPPHFQFFDSLEQLFLIAENKTSATVIFPCVTQNDIELISRLSYQLRTIAGNEIKILVREVTPCIRYSDERFLLGSGINLIVPAELSFSRFIGQKNAVKNQAYHRQLPADYSEVQRLRPEFDITGIADMVDFTQHVKSLITHQTNLAVDFALIRLDLLPGMTVQECLSLCRLQRAGDLATPCQNAIYLFLSAIRQNDITPTLNNIFKIDVGILFQQQTFYFNAGDILEELARARQTAITMGQESLDDFTKPVHNDESAIRRHQSRSYAKRFPLKRQSLKVLA